MSTMSLVRNITIALVLTTIVAAGAVLSGCRPGFLGNSENETSLENSTSNDLIMAWDASHEPASLDGHIEPYQPAWLIDSFIADPLLVIGPDGEFHPALATSWSSSLAADKWTFVLRDDVKFQDGTPFNASSVKYNIERILDPKTQSAEMAALVGPVENIEVVNDHTITLHYSRPWVSVLEEFTRVPIWSPTAAEKWGVQEFDRYLIGAGPFLLEEWVPNDHVKLKKWDDYGGWNGISRTSGPARLDSVTINFIGEKAVLGNVVMTGDADIAMNLPSDYVSDYENVEGFKLIKTYQAGTGLQMVFNTRKSPLNIPTFRQALLYGTDQTAINDLLYDGRYLPSYGPLNVTHPCHWDGNKHAYPYDLEKAKSLLEKSGYDDRDGDGIREAEGIQGVQDGTPLSIKWTVLHHEEIGEAVQSQWLRLGINLVVEKVPGPIQLDYVNNRNFDLMYERHRSRDAILLDMMWNSANDVVGGWAWTGFVSTELDSTTSKLRTLPSYEDRCNLAHTIQQIIMDNALMLPTLSEPMFYATTDRVADFQLTSEGYRFFLHNTYLRNN